MSFPSPFKLIYANNDAADIKIKIVQVSNLTLLSMAALWFTSFWDI